MTFFSTYFRTLIMFVPNIFFLTYESNMYILPEFNCVIYYDLYYFLNSILQFIIPCYIIVSLFSNDYFPNISTVLLLFITELNIEGYTISINRNQ